MNPTIKKACIFALGVGVSEMVLDQSATAAMTDEERRMTRRFARELSEASQMALDRCHIKIDRSTVRRVRNKIDLVANDKTEFDILEMLSFLFLGLQDLAHYCKDKKTIKRVEDAALNFMVLYDPNLEDQENHAAALARYNGWIEQ